MADRIELMEGLTPEELEMINRAREYAKLSELSDEELRSRLGVSDDQG